MGLKAVEANDGGWLLVRVDEDGYEEPKSMFSSLAQLQAYYPGVTEKAEE